MKCSACNKKMTFKRARMKVLNINKKRVLCPGRKKIADIYICSNKDCEKFNKEIEDKKNDDS